MPNKYEIYNPKTGDTLGRSFPTLGQANSFIKLLQANTSAKLHWKARKVNPQPRPRAGSRIMKNPKNPLTTKWTPAHVRKLPSGNIQVKIPLGKAVKSVAVVASKAKRKVKRVVRRVARKNPAGLGIHTRYQGSTRHLSDHRTRTAARAAAKKKANASGRPVEVADMYGAQFTYQPDGSVGHSRKNPVKRKATRKTTRKATRKTARKNPGAFEHGAWGNIWRLGRSYAMRGGSNPTTFWPKMVAAKVIPSQYKKDFMNGYKAGRAYLK